MGKPGGKLNRSGFTLMEIVVVMAVLVILVGLTSPSLLTYAQNAKKLEMNDHQELVQKAISQYFAYEGYFPALGLDPADEDHELSAAQKQELHDDLLSVTSARLNLDYTYTYNQSTGTCTLALP